MPFIHEFEWNAHTISAVATIFFSVAAAWGLYRQNRNIWQSRSGKSVSKIWFISACGMFTAMTIHGITAGDFVVAFGGITRAMPHYPILFGLWVFAGFTKGEWCMAAFMAAATAAMLIFAHTELFFLAIALVTLVPTAMQPVEILRTRSPGVVSIRLLTVFMVSCVFWVVYTLTTRDWLMFFFFGTSLVLFTATIALWFCFKNREVCCR